MLLATSSVATRNTSLRVQVTQTASTWHTSSFWKMILVQEGFLTMGSGSSLSERRCFERHLIKQEVATFLFPFAALPKWTFVCVTKGIQPQRTILRNTQTVCTINWTARVREVQTLVRGKKQRRHFAQHFLNIFAIDYGIALHVRLWTRGTYLK